MHSYHKNSVCYYTHTRMHLQMTFCWKIKFSSFQIIIVMHFHKHVLQCTIHFQIWRCSQYSVQGTAWARGIVVQILSLMLGILSSFTILKKHITDRIPVKANFSFLQTSKQVLVSTQPPIQQ
jgi:hypothetical protein